MQAQSEHESTELITVARQCAKRACQKFQQPWVKFQEAKDLCLDDTIKERASRGQLDCDKHADDLMDQLELMLSDSVVACDEVHFGDADLIAMYRAFSIEVERFALGDNIVRCGEVDRSPGVLSNMLKNTVKLLKKVTHKNKHIREVVIAACSSRLE
jgi:hypothetical protein